MKILIASDSHRMTANLLTAIDREKPDMLIHLGDIEDDPNPVAAAAGSPETPCIFIKGNCDYYSSGSVLIRRSVFTLHGHRFYCCHEVELCVLVGKFLRRTLSDKYLFVEYIDVHLFSFCHALLRDVDTIDLRVLTPFQQSANSKTSTTAHIKHSPTVLDIHEFQSPVG